MPHLLFCPILRAFKNWQIYKFKVKKKYFGLTQNSFKSRHSGHKTSFKYPKYKTQTRLSRAIWRLKESNPPIPFKLKFSILKLARAYTRESRNCHLCAVEKTFIAFSDPSSMLNLRSELLNKCRHRRKHLLFNWKWGINQRVFLKMIKKWEENIWGKNNSYNFVCLNVLVILIFAQSSLSHWWICKDETRCMAKVLILHLAPLGGYSFWRFINRFINRNSNSTAISATKLLFW